MSKDYDPFTYKNGLPFDTTLGKNLTGQQDRINSKKASLIIVDGGVGEGKTTLTVEVADFLNGSPISLEPKNHPQYAMGGKQFLAQLGVCFKNKFGVIIYDEAGDFNRRGALTRFNAMLNRTFETYRAFKIIVILVLPNFAVLDNDIYDKKIPRLLVNCWDRGATYGNYRGYSLYRMMYLREKMKKLTVKPLAYKYTTPNFYGHFKDLTPERSKQLDILSTEGKLKELKSAEIRIEGLVSYTDMSIKLACSIVKIKTHLKELKLKPIKYADRKAYFEGGVIDMLADQIDKKAEETYENLRNRRKANTKTYEEVEAK